MKNIVIKLLASMMLFAFAFSTNAVASEHEQSSLKASAHQEETYQPKPFGEMIVGFLKDTGVVAFVDPDPNELSSTGEKMSDFHKGWGRIIMILIVFLLFYLGIAKGFEPLLLLPIAFGGLLANIPIANIAGPMAF